MGDAPSIQPHRARRTSSTSSTGWDPVDLLFERPAWQHQAACNGTDPNLFHPARGDNTSHAKHVCAGCTVRDDYLQYALDTRQKFGIWGGLSERERRRIRPRRKPNRAA